LPNGDCIVHTVFLANEKSVLEFFTQPKFSLSSEPPYQNNGNKSNGGFPKCLRKVFQVFSTVWADLNGTVEDLVRAAISWPPMRRYVAMSSKFKQAFIKSTFGCSISIPFFSSASAENLSPFVRLEKALYKNNKKLSCSDPQCQYGLPFLWACLGVPPPPLLLLLLLLSSSSSSSSPPPPPLLLLLSSSLSPSHLVHSRTVR